MWPPPGMHADRAAVLDSSMAYVRGGTGPVLLFLHGNPTSSFLWRKVLAGLTDVADCVAVDLVGMGRSGKPDLDYGFADHARYLEAFADALGLRRVTVIGHDWGAVLGLHLLRRRPDIVGRIAVCEGHLRPFSGWSDMDPGSAGLFSQLRTPGIGERLVLEENFFVEQVLPAGMSHTLSSGEWAEYRAPFPEAADRKPVLRWVFQIPVGGDPPDVHEIVLANQETLLRNSVPRLLLYGTPGSVIDASVVSWCRARGTGLDVAHVGEGTHFLPEDQPSGIAEALRSWLRLSPAEP